MAFSLVNELEEDVVDRTTNKGSQVEEFAVNAMQRCLQEVALPGILRIEEFKKIEYERLVDMSLSHVNVEIWILHKSKEKFIDDL